MFSFPYFAVLRRAYALTIDHAWLWIFGIFAGSISGFIFFLADASRRSYWQLALPLGLLILFLAAAAKGALVWTVKEFHEKRHVTLRGALKHGWHYSGRIFIIQFLALIAAALVTAALVTPVMFMFFSHQVGEAVALIFLGAGILVPVIITLGFIGIYGPIALVLYKFSIRACLAFALDLFQTRLKESLLLAALLFGLFLLFLILLGFSIIVVGIPVAFFSIIFDSLHLAWPIYILVTIVGGAVVCGIVILSAAFAV